MCLAVPGRVVDIFRDHDLLMGKVDFNGVVRSACLEHVPETRVGDYVLVHVGFALSRIDEVEAERIRALLVELGEAAEAEEAP